MATVTWVLEADLDGDGVPETSLLSYIQMPSRGINISREQALGGTMKASTLKVQLSNRDGAFTPRNTSATIGRKLRTGVALRVTATHNAKSYTAWTGYVFSRKREKAGSSKPQLVTLDARSRMAFLADSQPVYVSLSSLRDVDNAISAIAVEAGLTPADVLDLWDSDQELEWHFSSGQNPLDAIVDAALSEMGGQLYELADGKIAFESRSSRIGLSQFQRAVRKDLPAGYWRLGERSGSVAYDYGANGLDGAYSGSPSLGQSTLLGVPDGACVNLEPGSRQFVSVPDDALLDPGDTFTIEALVNLTRLPVAATNLVANGGAETDTTGWGSYPTGSVARITTDAFFGSACFEFTPVALNDIALYSLAVSPNTTYTVQFRVKTPDTDIGLAVDEFTGAWAYITTNYASKSVTAGAWTYITMTLTTSGTTANVNIGLVAQNSTSPFKFDGVQCETGSDATWYIETDGATATRSAACIVDKGTDGFQLRINPSGELELLKTGTGIIVASTVAIAASATAHVMATKNGSTVKLYVDGADATGIVSNQTISATASALNVGRTVAGADHLDGKIQELAIYASALSSTRNAAHHDAAIGTRFAWGDGTTILPSEWSEDISDKDVLTHFKARGTNYLEGQNTNVVFEFSGNIFDSYIQNHVLELTAGQVWERRFQGAAVWVSLETPTATVDYLANDADDGSGTDRTSSLDVTVDDLGGGWLGIKLVNGHSGTIYVTFFQIRGIPLDYYADRAVVSIDLPIDKRFSTTRGSATDVPFVGSYSETLLKYAISELRIARYPIERLELEFTPDSDVEREAMLALEIGELVYYKDTAVGLAKGAYVDDWYYVTGIEHFLPVGIASKVWSTRVQLTPSYNWRLTDQLEHDDFNRDDASGDLGKATTGGAWQDDTGFDIDTLTCVPNTDTEQVAWIDLGALAFDQVVEAKFTDITGSDALFGVAWRCQDADNCYVAFLDLASEELAFGKLVGGTYTELATVAWTPTTSAELRAMGQGSRHRIWLDGEIWIDTTDTTQNTGTGVGLYTKNASAEVAIRNWYGGRL